MRLHCIFSIKMDLKVLVVDPKNQDPQKYAEKGDKSKMIWGSKSTNALELKNLIFLNGASVKSYHSGYIREIFIVIYLPSKSI